MGSCLSVIKGHEAYSIRWQWVRENLWSPASISSHSQDRLGDPVSCFHNQTSRKSNHGERTMHKIPCKNYMFCWSFLGFMHFEIELVVSFGDAKRMACTEKALIPRDPNIGQDWYTATWTNGLPRKPPGQTIFMKGMLAWSWYDKFILPLIIGQTNRTNIMMDSFMHQTFLPIQEVDMVQGSTLSHGRLGFCQWQKQHSRWVIIIPPHTIVGRGKPMFGWIGKTLADDKGTHDATGIKNNLSDGQEHEGK